MLPVPVYPQGMPQIECPACGRDDSLRGVRRETAIDITCDACGQVWERSLDPSCPTCGGSDLQEAPLAIVEKGRGTQLSVVGIRIIQLCTVCDAGTLATYHRNRPNPLMPSDLPHIGY